MHSLADSYAFWITLVAALGVLYILPSLIGVLRRVDYLGYLIALNLLGGMAAIGWPAALICAFILPRRQPHRRRRQRPCSAMGCDPSRGDDDSGRPHIG